MIDENKYPCEVTKEELGFLISFLLGQMPRSVVLDFASKDGTKRGPAKEQMAKIIVERLALFHIRKGPPLGPHDGSATRRADKV